MDLALMLTYYFPPLGGGGVQRSTKFYKYLPENGWEPLVLCAEVNPRNRIEQGLDSSGLPDVSGSGAIIRTPCKQFNRLYALLTRLRLRKLLFEAERIVPMLHMDYKSGWYASTLRVARRIVRESPVRIIYTSSPPYSAHWVGRHLQRETGLPWVADFRDPWTQMATYRGVTPLHERIDRRFERIILHEADAVIANTPINRERLIDGFGLEPGKVHVISNGFDAEDFEGPRENPPISGEFTLSCVGKFYETDDPGQFFRAFRRFAERHPDARLRILGRFSRGVRVIAERSLRPETWEETDRIAHDQAVAWMRRSSTLLVNVPGTAAAHWVPGKLYEYLGADRPILLIAPHDGDAAAIVRDTATGLVVPHCEESILEALEKLYRGWQAGFPSWKPDPQAIARFERRVQTRALASIFDALVGVRGASRAALQGT